MSLVIMSNLMSTPRPLALMIVHCMSNITKGPRYAPLGAGSMVQAHVLDIHHY